MAGLKNLISSIATGAKPRWSLFLSYAKVELRPPMPNEIGQVASGFKNVLVGLKGGWRELTVKEAWLNTLVATEVGMWFFIGEVIGRGHLVGYKFPAEYAGHH